MDEQHVPFSRISRVGAGRKPLRRDWDYRTKVPPVAYSSALGPKPTRPTIVLKNVQKSEIPRILKSLTPDNEVDNFFQKRKIDFFPTSENLKFEVEVPPITITSLSEDQQNNPSIPPTNNSTMNKVSYKNVHSLGSRNYPKPWLIKPETRDVPAIYEKNRNKEGRKTLKEMQNNYTEHEPPWRRNPPPENANTIEQDEGTQVNSLELIGTKINVETQRERPRKDKFKIRVPRYRKRRPMTPGINPTAHIQNRKEGTLARPWEASSQFPENEDDKDKGNTSGSQSVARKLDEALGNNGTKGQQRLSLDYGQRSKAFGFSAGRHHRARTRIAPQTSSQIEFFTFEEAVNGIRKNLAEIINYELQTEEMNFADHVDLKYDQMAHNMTTFVFDAKDKTLTMPTRSEFYSADSPKGIPESFRANHFTQASEINHIDHAMEQKQVGLDHNMNALLVGSSQTFKMPVISEFYPRQDPGSGFPQSFRTRPLSRISEDPEETEDIAENIRYGANANRMGENMYVQMVPLRNYANCHIDEYKCSNHSKYKTPMTPVTLQDFRSTHALDSDDPPLLQNRARTGEYYLQLCMMQKSSTLGRSEPSGYILPPPHSESRTNHGSNYYEEELQNNLARSRIGLESDSIDLEYLKQSYVNKAPSSRNCLRADGYILPSPPSTPPTLYPDLCYSNYGDDNTFEYNLVKPQQSRSAEFITKEQNDGMRNEDYLMRFCLKTPCTALRHAGTDEQFVPSTPTTLSADSSNASLRVLVSREKHPIKSIPSCNCENCRKCREYLLCQRQNTARKSQSLSCLDQTNYVWKNIVEMKKYKKQAPKNPKKLFVDHPKGDRVPPMVLYAGRKGYGQVPEYLKKRKEEVLADKQARLEEHLQRTLTEINALEDRRTKSRRFLIKELAVESKEKIPEDQAKAKEKSKRESFPQSSSTKFRKGKESRKYDDIFIGSYHPTPNEEEELEAQRSERFESKSTDEEGNEEVEEPVSKVSSHKSVPGSRRTTKIRRKIQRGIISAPGKYKPIVQPHSSGSEPSIDISVSDVRITPSLPDNIQR